MGTIELEVIERDAQTHIAMSAYVCPDCKTPLIHLYCPQCRYEFPCPDGIPSLLARDPRFAQSQSIAASYDALYAARSSVWENQGRTPEFIRYFSSLLSHYSGERFLEIGCGEGFLLSAVSRKQSYAVDLSLEALRKARGRADSRLSLALSERLPFPNDYFDLITSVGVMEHFLDIQEGLREIRRVLRPGGHYISLTHVAMSLPERIGAKISEFVFPRPRPLRFAEWIRYKRRTRLPRQPIQNRYTTEGARAWLTGAGFNVRRVLRRRKSNSDLPFIGPYVVIYIAEK